MTTPIRTSAQHQQRLLMHKAKIQSFLRKRDFQQPIQPNKSSKFESTSSILRDIPTSSLALSESQNINESIPSVIEQSQLAISSVTVNNQKQKNIVDQIDSLVEKIKNKRTQVLPASSILQPSIDKSQVKRSIVVDFQQDVLPSVVINKKQLSPVKPILRHNQLKQTKRSTSKSVRITQQESSTPKQKSVLLPPKPPISKQKEQFKQMVNKYNTLQQQAPPTPVIHPHHNTPTTSNADIFELSLTVDQRSAVSDLTHIMQLDKELHPTHSQDIVLQRLYAQRKHILQQIEAIDEQIFTLQSL